MANALTRAIAPTLTVIDGQPTTTSADVARHFGKRHDNVMRDIQTLLPQLSAEHALNFEEMFTETQIGQGATRQDPAYRITKKGFTLLAFGFTGKKALQFKLDYIDEFERKEAEIAELRNSAISENPAQLPGSVKPPVSALPLSDTPMSTSPSPTPALPFSIDTLLTFIASGMMNRDALLRIANESGEALFTDVCNTKDTSGWGEAVAKQITHDLPQADLRLIVNKAVLELWTRSLMPKTARVAPQRSQFTT